MGESLGHGGGWIYRMSSEYRHLTLIIPLGEPLSCSEKPKVDATPEDVIKVAQKKASGKIIIQRSNKFAD